MRGLAYNPDILPAELIIRMKFKPMPTREELLLISGFWEVQHDNRQTGVT
ncbi:DUF2737 family protein [Salmonella enterica]|nr:DUF2737 family protein [Salmonella enterica]EID6626805.1 DUF2737 family protein [Salmonella enterica]ELF2405188.1 DUF2737 family protein [Salmonella enterica]